MRARSSLSFDAYLQLVIYDDGLIYASSNHQHFRTFGASMVRCSKSVAFKICISCRSCRIKYNNNICDIVLYTCLSLFLSFCLKISRVVHSARRIHRCSRFASCTIDKASFCYFGFYFFVTNIYTLFHDCCHRINVPRRVGSLFLCTHCIHARPTRTHSNNAYIDTSSEVVTAFHQSPHSLLAELFL